MLNEKIVKGYFYYRPLNGFIFFNVFMKIIKMYYILILCKNNKTSSFGGTTFKNYPQENDLYKNHPSKTTIFKI
jgi:hypothetical protein